MKVQRTLRIKPKHTSKVFKEGLDPGVLVTQEFEVDIPDNWNDTRVAIGMHELSEVFMHEYCEVIYKKL